MTLPDSITIEIGDNLARNLRTLIFSAAIVTVPVMVVLLLIVKALWGAG